MNLISNVRGKNTFEEMKRLDQALSSPHRSFRSIHIAGTNGKGSVATKIAAVLSRIGYRVGLYTSPHLFDIKERIEINGQRIDQQTFDHLFQKVYSPLLSLFDCLTAVAFLYFQEKKVDFAVIETGMGGRLDATNVITPILSIITSIGLDHEEILGPSLEDIAREKGGIIKPNVPLVVGPSAARYFPFAKSSLKAPTYEMENRLLAKLALSELGIEEEDGLEANPPGRFQKVGTCIFDAAHNPLGFYRLRQNLEYFYPKQKHTFYLGFSLHKKWRECVEIIKPIASKISMVQSSHPELLKEYPGYEMILPKEIQGGVVAGSFYLFSDCMPDVIQKREGAPSLSHL